MHASFGGPNRYYDAAHHAPRAPAPATRTARAAALLPGDTRDTVVSAFKAHNQAIRTRLRNETGLDLIHGEDRMAIPVEVKDGLPAPLDGRLRAIPDDLLELVFHAAEVERAAATLATVQHHLPTIARWQNLRSDGVPPSATLQDAERFLRELGAALLSANFNDLLLKTEEDTLGAYFFRDSRVELYWLPIGLAARLLGVRVEDLTVVVLAHELAHGYTHIGADVDGFRWDTGAFAAADLLLVEGLAQFYTDVVTAALAPRLAGGRQAFERLLMVQSDVYTRYREWGIADAVQGDLFAPTTRERLGEPVRAALIEARNRGMTSHTELRAAIGAAVTRLVPRAQPRRTV